MSDFLILSSFIIIMFILMLILVNYVGKLEKKVERVNLKLSYKQKYPEFCINLNEMADFTKCTNIECANKNQCFRWCCKTSTHQSYQRFEPNEKGKCEFYTPITKYLE